MSVLTITYESFLPRSLPEGNTGGAHNDAVCMLLSFLALPCRDARGALLVRSSTQRMHTQQASEAISNFAEVRDRTWSEWSGGECAGC